MGALMGSYLIGIRLVATPLPLYGPDEGSILDFLSQTSAWAESALIWRTPPLGIMAGPYIRLREGSEMCHRRSIRSYCRLPVEPIGC